MANASETMNLERQPTGKGDGVPAAPQTPSANLAPPLPPPALVSAWGTKSGLATGEVPVIAWNIVERLVDELTVSLAKTVLEEEEDDVDVSNKVEEKSDEENEKAQVLKLRLIEQFTMGIQEKYVAFLDEEDGLELLTTEARRLIPLYRSVSKRIRSEELDFFDLDFVHMRPVIAWNVLQRIMDDLNDDVAPRGYGHSHNGIPCNGHHGPPRPMPPRARPPKIPPHPHARPPPRAPPHPKAQPPQTPPPGRRQEILDSFTPEKRELVMNFLKWAQKWVASDELINEIQSKCENKNSKEKQQIMQKVYTQGYNKEWIKLVEKDLNVKQFSAERRLTFAIQKYITQGKKDYYYYCIEKLFKKFREAEQKSFLICIHGKEGYEKREERAKKIDSYSKEVQDKFLVFLDAEDGIEKLREEARKLTKVYREIEGKIDNDELDVEEMGFEAMKPMIEFQSLQKLLRHVTRIGTSTSRGGAPQCGAGCRCGKPAEDRGKVSGRLSTSQPVVKKGKKQPVKPKTWKRRVKKNAYPEVKLF
jgi:hypothetical protein